MDISPFALPSIAPTSVSTIIGVRPGALQTEALTKTSIPALESNASIVDLSTLGQLLSTAASFQTQAVNAFPDNTGSQAGNNAELGFGNLVLAAQVLVDALNNLQSGNIDSLQNPLSTNVDNTQLFTAQPPLANGESLLAGLAQVGIVEEPGPISPNVDPTVPASTRFTLDLPALQSAFNANPSDTSSVLAQASQALAKLIANLAGQNFALLTTDTTSILPENIASSPGNGGDFSAALASLNGIDTIEAQAALQRLLADQALENAVSASSPPSTPSASTGAATASLPADTLAADTSLALPASVAQTESNSNPTATAAGTIDLMTQSSIAAATSVATPNTQADATSQPESPESTLNTPVADTSATATTNPAAGISAPAIVDATVDTGPAAAQSALPIDAAQSLAIDPSVAAAVAAYRVNVLGATLNNMPDSLPKPVSDIAAVSRIQPASLDPHDESAQSRRNEAARNAVQALAQRKVSHKFPG